MRLVSGTHKTKKAEQQTVELINLVSPTDSLRKNAMKNGKEVLVVTNIQNQK